MNILYLATSVLPSKSANSVHVMKMSNSFSKITKTSLIARGSREDISGDFIKDYYGVDGDFKIKKSAVGKKGKKFIYSVPYIIKELLRHDKKESVIYARDLYGCILAMMMGYYVIYESHGITSSKKSYFLEKTLFKSNKFIQLVVISNALKNLYMSGDYGLVSDRVTVAHDAADVPKSYQDSCIERNKVKVTYIGHLYKGRGIDIIISAAKRLPELDFEIVGGNKDDITYWEANSSSNVTFIGHVKPSETFLYRQGADILVMPYQSSVSVEGGGDTSKWMSPMKLFEYMSSKKPIVSSDLPVLREVLNEENSVLVSPNIVDEWVEAISNLSTKENLRKEISEKAYLDFIANYTWDNRAKRIYKIICDRVSLNFKV